MSPFPEDFSKSLALGKYSRWAQDLDEETLRALCWFIGEFAGRTPIKAYAAESYAARFPFPGANERSDTGLEVVLEIYHGAKFAGFEEIIARLDRGVTERSDSMQAAREARGNPTAESRLIDLFHQPLMLVGEHVILEPMGDHHAGDLLRALDGDEEIWRYIPVPQPRTVMEMRALIASCLQDQARRVRLPFVVLDKTDRKVIGSTSYVNVSPLNRHLDIGWTWYAKSHWRSAVNTECKYLLLRHAFETLGCIRVQFRVDERNERSQRAVERIGGMKEGVLRKVQLLHDGHERNVGIFSILAEEWPARKLWFEERLGR